MRTIYELDSRSIWTGAVRSITNREGRPVNWVVSSEPPVLTGTEVAHWSAGGWVVLSEYPAPPATEPAVPGAVTRAQGKAALITAGLWSMVLDYVASIDDPAQQALAEVALYDTLEWRRTSPFLSEAADAIGLTQEQLDALFIAAGQIEL
jgi:hypothetical protein